jgi:DNA polymerase-3 subunit beta
VLSFSINNISLLQNALAALQPLVPKKPTRDVLKCIKVIAKTGSRGASDSIVLLATDLETFGVKIVDDDVIVNKEGECVVPAQTFLNYIKSLEGRVSITLTQNEKLKLDSDGTEFEVGLQDVDEYPEFPEIPKDDNIIDVSLADMINALNCVVFAVAEKGSPRWGSLSAVCVEINGKVMSLIGTDQARASVVDIDVSSKLKDKQYLVSAKALALLPKLFNESFKLSTADKNTLIFANEDSRFFLRLMHGNYPPVRNFIPKKYPNKLKIDPSIFLKQAKKAALAADEHSSIKISLTKNKLTLSTKTRQQRKVAKIKQEIDYKGPDFDFSLNCKFLLDVLRVFSNQDIEIEFNQNNQPILFSQDNFKHVCVPLETR